MKNLLFILLVLTAKAVTAQYCGTSNSSICTPNSTLTSPGISDYSTFPCVHDSTAYSQIMEIYFPSSVSASGFNVTVDSVRIDSITNLPCGMCWAANEPSLTYPGLGRACIKLSGTTNDATGAYKLNLYGTAYTSFGPFAGNLNIAGLSFFLNVVGKNAACTAIDTNHLFTACNGGDTTITIIPVVPRVPCTFKIDATCTPVANCNFDSATITLTSPLSSTYRHYWTSLNLQAGMFVLDSTSTSFIFHRHDAFAELIAVDSTGCGDTLTFDLNESAGPIVTQSICYGTTDTSQTSSLVKFVFERNDLLNIINTYTLYRQDSDNAAGHGYVLQVGSSLGSAPGYIVDAHPHPMDTSYSYCGQCDLNTYHIGYTTTCGDTQINGNLFVNSELRVLRYPATGQPYLVWTPSNPLNYDSLFVFSRNHNGHWRLRYTTTSPIAGQWLDSQPDSNSMEYVLGYHLTVDCDPLRSSSHYAFSNFGAVRIADSLVVPDTAVVAPNGIAAYSAASSIMVYPNPATAQLNIQMRNVGDADMRIYDMTGQLVISSALSGKQVNEINVGMLAPDVYLLEIRQNNTRVAVKRFIKQ